MASRNKPRQRTDRALDQIDQCMIADRFRLRRQQKQNGGKSIRGSVERSIKRVAARRSALPAHIQFPEQLPVSGKVEEIRAALTHHQVVIVAGETGSGKTTQLPKICLEAGRGVFGVIGHTQPRRVAARTVAHRIAEELNVAVGESVGYQIRFGDKTSPNTHVKVMTDGVLLAETRNDRFLERYDTLIIDEAHERSLNIDFLLGYIKRILPKRQDLKIIITSATIDVDSFSRHFSNAPVIEVSGRTYPVEVAYRPLDELLADAGDAADDDPVTTGILRVMQEVEQREKGHRRTADVLVFLPGEREIREASLALRRASLNGWEVLPLYSRLSHVEQDRVFQPHGGRRVVLATNVAETSITVPGIRYVIDPGLARVSRYSIRAKVQQLPIEPVSQASARQRAGRCGRISEGVCFRLYSEEDFEKRAEFTAPEIMRTNLASVILQMLSLKLGDIDRFPFLERPDKKQINDGYHLLFELGAVDKDRHMSRLGRDLVRIPVDLRLGRMLIAAHQHGVLAEVLVIVSVLAIADPRERPMDARQAADQSHAQFDDERSDFLGFLNLWRSFEDKRQSLSQRQLRKYCRENFLSWMRMREWREHHRQLRLICSELGMRANRQPAEYDALHQALLAGLLGNIGHRVDENTYLGPRGRQHFLFPASTLFKRKPAWVMSAELTETTRLYART
ncbi:MAG: ATP-dependent RNA helicase HrpA, partial [Pseudomonadota bacterium]